MQRDPLLEFAIATARAAGELLLEHRGRELEISTKSSAFDLVTSADRAAEALIIERVRQRYPEHGVLAEESGLARTSAAGPHGALQWIIDPLDGTTNFAHGIPHFCVSIALEDSGGTRLGVVHDPVRDETFSAARGGGAWLEARAGERPEALRVSSCAALDEAVLATGFSYGRARAEKAPDWIDNLAEFLAIAPRIRGLRRAGSAALDLAYVAAGRLDGYWEYHLQPWDTAAGGLLVREAGGELLTLTPLADPPRWTPVIPDLVCAGPGLLPVLRGALRAARPLTR